MALTKGRSAITQLTAGGTSTSLDVSASYAHTLYVRHTNGSATITVGATIRVQAKPSGGTFIDLATFTASTTASTVDPFLCRLPDDAATVQMIYTYPTGGSGHTLDAEVGTITAL